MNEPESVLPSAPSPEPMLTPRQEGPVRRFFRDIDSAGNLEDGMEFHAAGIVIEANLEIENATPEITVLYLNPFTAKVELRRRDLSSVALYQFPPDDGVYWHLWEQTRTTLEGLRAAQ